MTAARRALAAVLLNVAVVTTACASAGQATTSTTGTTTTRPPTMPAARATITGVADACASMVLPGSLPPVTVSLERSGRVVDRRRISSGSTYRFSVAPGHYVVDVPPYRPRVVELRAGTLARIDFPDLCKAAAAWPAANKLLTTLRRQPIVDRWPTISGRHRSTG